MKFNYDDLFPHEAIRDEQQEAIDFALDAFVNERKRFVIIEAGTGVGKSAAAVTIARYLETHVVPPSEYAKGAYFLTTQKLLQDQYVSDFGLSAGPMVSIKSSTNYTCKHYKNNSCSESLRLLRTTDRGSKFFKTCTVRCRYKQAKKEFLESTEGVTNFSYALAEAAYSGKVVPRNVLVIDEAHNAESELSKFIEIIISEKFTAEMLSLTWPKQLTQFQAFKWVRDVYFPRAKRQYDHVQGIIGRYTDLEKTMKEFAKIARQFDILGGHVKRLETFLRVYDKDNWVFENIPAFGRSKRKFSFRAIDMSSFAHDYLLRLGCHVIMMSATILDKDAFCQSLGIPIDDTAFISIPSPFDIENRPIFYMGVGHMNRKEIHNTMPALKEAVREILSHHKDEKGIIHCHTFQIAKFLKYNLKDGRVLIHDSTNREQVLRQHIESKKPTVLLSPSMTEGVDLHGDISRFQIVCKVPYPYYGDPLIRKRMNKWSWWYPLQTAKTIVQATGRSIRNNEDHAVTYILDSDWQNFFNRSRLLFPHDFRKRIQ